MKTPSHFKHQLPGVNPRKTEEQTSVIRPAFKRNLLLTPFLLSLPVICIVFALTSDLNAGLDRVTAEPLQRENYAPYDNGTITDFSNTTVLKTDSISGSAGSNTVAFSAKH